MQRKNKIQSVATADPENARTGCCVCREHLSTYSLACSSIAHQMHRSRQLPAHPLNKIWISTRLPDAQEKCAWISDRRYCLRPRAKREKDGDLHWSSRYSCNWVF